MFSKKIGAIPACFLAAFALSSSTGCGSKKEVPTPLSPVVMRFTKDFAPTIMSHGKVVTPTLREQGEYIHYQTEDGQKWRVRYKLDADDGEYQFDAPQQAN